MKAIKGAPFMWTPEANSAAFEALRDAMLTAPVLCHCDSSRPSTLSTDASDFAIAGVLHQLDNDGPGGLRGLRQGATHNLRVVTVVPRALISA